jgi:mannose-6-phosphate isomerase-like protein (cupin superfamily)
MPAPFVQDIDAISMENRYYRRVIFTTKHQQLVVMCLRPGETIPPEDEGGDGGEEHQGDQFFKIVDGEGVFYINNDRWVVKEGYSTTIPAHTPHLFKNESNKDVKIYTIYSPPQHPDGTIQYFDQRTGKLMDIGH